MTGPAVRRLSFRIRSRRTAISTCPDKPGLGVDIDEEFVARYPSERNVSNPGKSTDTSYAAGTSDEHVYVQTRLRRGIYFGKD